ncbi:DUF1559 domain-containing protein [Tundrisphaera lichenicola]|uniref:DUF1559 family PulG-like putative transporter n=1 Tax=Tundrisphaera lichenicola TaxID=2029860 RepID=UPI003EBD40AD
MGLFLPARRTVRPSGRRLQCISNLRQVALGLHGYHSTYGCYPPPYIADASGKPMHSWRTLILPWIDNKEQYDAYKFDEPWDGPNNRKIADTGIGIYHCPVGTREPPGLTDYVVIRGPGTAFPGGGRKVTDRDVLDGTASTIMVVEVANSGIHWAEPRDLDFERMSFQLNDPSRPSISSPHEGGANVIMIDGSGKFLLDTVPPSVIRAMITIDGHEPIPKDE